MQENHLFEYAVIRVVPRVEREEFINAGVILYCAAEKFLDVLFDLNNERLQAFAGDADLIEIKDHLLAFDRICKGGAGGGPIAKLPIADRFRWLTAARSTVVQTSKVHPGMCTDAKETLGKLHNQLVML